MEHWEAWDERLAACPTTVTVGTTTTVPNIDGAAPGVATVTLDAASTPGAAILNFGIPAGIVRRIYERLDVRLSEVAAERMQRLASARSQYEEARRDRTAMADLGLDCAAEKPRFDEYCSRFGI